MCLFCNWFYYYRIIDDFTRSYPFLEDFSFSDEFCSVLCYCLHQSALFVDIPEYDLCLVLTFFFHFGVGYKKVHLTFNNVEDSFRSQIRYITFLGVIINEYSKV